MQKDGRFSLSLFLFMVLFCLALVSIAVMGIVDRVELLTPDNNINTSNRTISFTCNASKGNFTNISLWANDTGSWENKSTNLSTENGTVQTFNISLPSTVTNLTFDWTCRVYNKSTGALFNYSPTNFTVHIDAVPPAILPLKPIGLDPTQANYTSMPIVVNVTVADERFAGLHSVWVVIYERSTAPYGANLTLMMADPTNANTGIVINATGTIYEMNITPFFADNRTAPGDHAILFCANDTAGNVACGNTTGVTSGVANALIIRGSNMSSMEDMKWSNGSARMRIYIANSSANSGWQLPGANHFFDPVLNNYTLVFNFTDVLGNVINVSLVGLNINSSRLAGVNTTQIETRMSTFNGALGGNEGFNSTAAWLNVSNFIPDFVSYRYGKIVMGRTSDRKYYCNGTASAPNCFALSECSDTVYYENASLTIGAGCWRTESGKTAIYVDHFSGVGESTDLQPPNIMSVNSDGCVDSCNVNLSSNSVVINMSFNDTGVGLDNDSINITVNNNTGGQPNYNFSLKNGKLVCSPTATANLSNTTVYCSFNVTLEDSVNGLGGTWTVNASARDGKGQLQNHSNAHGVLALYVDTKPPFHYIFEMNRSYVTENSNFSRSWTGGDVINYTDTNAVAEGSQINVVTMWNDSVSGLYAGRLEVYNTSSGQWFIANYTEANAVRHGRNEGDGVTGVDIYINISWKLPSGHNWFGAGTKNLSLRVVVNDTVGNSNTSVQNFTIKVNDTTSAVITGLFINGTNSSAKNNLSSNTVKLNFTFTETADIVWINYSVDGDRAVTGETVAGLFRSFSISDGLITSQADLNSLKTSDNAQASWGLPLRIPTAATLAEGNHSINLSVMDNSSNKMTMIFSFIVDTTAPNATNSSSNYENDTRIRLMEPFTFLAGDYSGTGVKTAVYYTSCNTTSTSFKNSSSFQPFNNSICAGVAQAVTLTINATDYAGNSNVTIWRYQVDDVVPVINSFTVTTGGDQLVGLSWNASDAFTNISNITYFIDTNNTAYTLGNGTAINSTTLNVSIGTHTIKLRANDSVGNSINGSVITFTVQGPVSTGGHLDRIREYNVNNTRTNSSFSMTLANGTTKFSGSGYMNQSLDLVITANHTRLAEFTNVTIKVDNGSKLMWDLNFGVSVNNTNFITNVENYYRVKVERLIYFNETFDRFMTDNSTYYAIVTLSNATGADSYNKLMWFPSVSTVIGAGSFTNVTSCSALSLTDASYSTSTDTVPCYNSSRPENFTKVFVPHFGALVAANDSIPPNITIITPPKTNITVSTFQFNISVTLDAVACEFAYNRTNLAINGSMNITPDQGGYKLCTSMYINVNRSYPLIRDNVTFYVTDEAGNKNITWVWFNVSDTSAPNTTGPVGLTVVGRTQVNLNWNATEHVNSTVSYGDTAALGSTVDSSAIQAEQTVSVTGLTAGTLYYFNVTYCDYQQNCRTNGTFNATTDAAESTAAAGSGGGSGGGGGGGGGAAGIESNIAAKASQYWTSVPANSEISVGVTNTKIAITDVTTTVANSLTSVTLNVFSLKDKPSTTSAPVTNVYQYLEIKPEGLETKDVSSVDIRFKITQQWLKDLGIAKEDVVLYRFVGGGWVALTTKTVKYDTMYVYYSAASPGFSYFAIGSSAVPPTVVPPSEEKPVVQPEEPVEEAPVAPVVEEKGQGGLIATIIIVLVLLAVLVGYYLYERKRAS
ncbi:PGF-pre-PGF domain-containing protein [Candidatus Woesearchaeota archaeon]|nr:PGF-pre-PGF domain-containing protein [Candidatus Woesearchaeota archaeon]